MVWTVDDHFISPLGSGTRTGADPANAAAFTAGGDITALQNWLVARRLAYVADPLLRGRNIPEVHKTLTGGPEVGYTQYLSYIEDPKQAVICVRVHFITDQGTYPASVGDGNYVMGMGVAHGGIPATGTLGDPHRKVEFIGYRRSDGATPYDAPGPMITKTVSCQKKAGVLSDWTNPANYDASGWWTGAWITVNRTFTVQDPSPIRALFVGSATDDPRTQAQLTTHLWNVASLPRRLANCQDRTRVEPYVVNAGGQAIQVYGGWVISRDGTQELQGTGLPKTATVTDPVTGLVTPQPVLTYRSGSYVWSTSASCINFTGFEFRRVMAPFQMQYGAAQLIKVQDVVTDLTKYFMNHPALKTDMQVSRLRFTRNSEKSFSMGAGCDRWLLEDIQGDGQGMLGDEIQGLFASNSTDLAGTVRLQRMILVNFGGSYPRSNSVYVNGDGVDAEVNGGLAIRHVYTENMADGGYDSKSAAGFANAPSTICVDCLMVGPKRALRNWSPSVPEQKLHRQVSVVLDCTVLDARQIGLFPVPQGGHHKEITWDNSASGWAHLMGSQPIWTGIAVDMPLAGDATVTIICPGDARTSPTKGAVVDKESAAGLVRTGLPPYVFRTYRRTSPVAEIQVQVNGVVTVPGANVLVHDGDVRTFHALAPAGSTVSYTVQGSATTTVNGAGDLVATFHST